MKGRTCQKREKKKKKKICSVEDKLYLPTRMNGISQKKVPGTNGSALTKPL